MFWHFLIDLTAAGAFGLFKFLTGFYQFLLFWPLWQLRFLHNLAALAILTFLVILTVMVVWEVIDVFTMWGILTILNILTILSYFVSWSFCCRLGCFFLTPGALSLRTFRNLPESLFIFLDGFRSLWQSKLSIVLEILATMTNLIISVILTVLPHFDNIRRFWQFGVFFAGGI